MHLLETLRLIKLLCILQAKPYQVHGKFGEHECFSMIFVIILTFSNEYHSKLSSISLLIFSLLYFKFFSAQ